MKKGILIKKIGVPSIAFMRTTSPFASFSASGFFWFSFLTTCELLLGDDVVQSVDGCSSLVRYIFHDAALLCKLPCYRLPCFHQLSQVVAQILYVLASKNTLVISTPALRLSTHVSPVCVHNAFVLFALFQMVQLVHLNFVFWTTAPEPVPSPHSTTTISSSQHNEQNSNQLSQSSQER